VSTKGKEFYCPRCAKYISHDIYISLGYCDSKSQIIPKAEGACEHFEAIDVDKAFKENGWMYCISCKKPFFSVEELGDHIGHMMSSKVYQDDIASEESPSGD
jgi:hypothetical protein